MSRNVALTLASIAFVSDICLLIAGNERNRLIEARHEAVVHPARPADITPSYIDLELGVACYGTFGAGYGFSCVHIK